MHVNTSSKLIFEFKGMPLKSKIGVEVPLKSKIGFGGYEIIFFSNLKAVSLNMN